MKSKSAILRITILGLAIVVQSSFCQAAADGEVFVPNSVKCPEDNGGVFELVSVNPEGVKELVTVTFADERPLKISLLMADAASDEFVELMSVKLSSPDPEEVQSGEHALKTLQPFLDEVCGESDPSEREKNWSQLMQQRR